MRKLLTMLLVSFLVGCGRVPDQPPTKSSPQSAMKRPATLETAMKSDGDQSRSGIPLPTGWLRIVNRSTGLVLGGASSVWRIETAGDFCKMRNQNSGQYMALADWSKNRDDAADAKGRPLRFLRQVPDSGSPSVLWKIEPLGRGFWKIVNHESGKCLEARENNSVKIVRQSLFREGTPTQEWRLETASATAVKDDGQRTPSADAETEPAAETLADQATDRQLNCGHLAIGDTGTITPPCAYVEILKIIDDQSAIVLPYEWVSPQTGPRFVELADLPNVMSERVLAPQLPLLLKGLSTAGKVTGEKDELPGRVFRVTGTEDVKRSSGDVVRVHVLELVQ